MTDEERQNLRLSRRTWEIEDSLETDMLLEHLMSISRIAIEKVDGHYTVIRLDEVAGTAEFVSKGKTLLLALQNAKKALNG